VPVIATTFSSFGHEGDSGAIPLWSGLVTVGVSYFVFLAISYLADIYLETTEPEPNFPMVALSLAFFPKLLQGPIERAEVLLPQLRSSFRFDYAMARSGLALFLWGLFKKVVVADRLGIVVDAVYGNLHDYHGVTLVLATYCYAVQIYCDFSAYTDMALGTARLFNIHLTPNFNSPYLATSVADFWRRWHITFSRWILDYIFKPLQLAWRDWHSAGTVAALVVTFLVSGIWHGATWGFVVWGLLHGIFLSMATLYRPYQKKIYQSLGLAGRPAVRWWQIFVTFNLICLAWIFFRAASVQEGWYVIVNLLHLGNSGLGLLLNQLKKVDVAILVVALPLLALLHLYGEENVLQRVLAARLSWQRWSIYSGLVVTIILFRVDTATTFIYFQF
jgi:D-alanyl-lipoteichoic acid acyltransferase DltB (MBOAT superfamily)